MAQPTQVSGGGWAVDKPVGGLEGHSHLGKKKQLKGKIVKTYHGR